MVILETIQAKFSDAVCFRAFAQDFYEAYKSYKPSMGSSVANYHLLCMSIESAAKALHSDQSKDWKKIKYRIKHDLEKACKEDILKIYEISLDEHEETALKKANDIYSKKGFEYFIYEDIVRGNNKSISNKVQRLHEMMAGNPNLPALDILESILKKLLSAQLINP